MLAISVGVISVHQRAIFDLAGGRAGFVPEKSNADRSIFVQQRIVRTGVGNTRRLHELPLPSPGGQLREGKRSCAKSSGPKKFPASEPSLIVHTNT
jgi:hypothetical protein